MILIVDIFLFFRMVFGVVKKLKLIRMVFVVGGCVGLVKVCRWIMDLCWLGLSSVFLFGLGRLVGLIVGCVC